MSDSAGQFVWYDVMTTDPGAAAEFYGKVVGWTVTDSGMPGQAYLLLNVGDTAIGGIMPIPPDSAAAGVRPAWMGYIGVADVDAAADAIRAEGGHVHRPPADIPGVGRFAVVSDPHGAGFLVFRGNSPDGPPKREPLKPGHIAWNELHAGDREEALAWYCGQFGWRPVERNAMTPDFIYQTVAMGTQEANGGVMTRMHFEPAPYWAYYFGVADIDAAAERVTANGGAVLMGPHQVPGGAWILNCRDPQGAQFNLLGQRTQASAA